MKPISQSEREIAENAHFEFKNKKKSLKEKTFELRPIPRIREIPAFKDIVIRQKAKNEKQFIQNLIGNNQSTSLANFKKLDLSNEKYEKVDFNGSYFYECNLTNVVFNNCNLQNAWFTKTNLTNITFINCNLLHLRIDKCNMERVDFSYNDMRGSYIGLAMNHKDSKFNMKDINLTGSNIYGAEFGYKASNRISKEKLLIDFNTPFNLILTTFSDIKGS